MTSLCLEVIKNIMKRIWFIFLGLRILFFCFCFYSTNLLHMSFCLPFLSRCIADLAGSCYGTAKQFFNIKTEVIEE